MKFMDAWAGDGVDAGRFISVMQNVPNMHRKHLDSYLTQEAISLPSSSIKVGQIC